MRTSLSLLLALGCVGPALANNDASSEAILVPISIAEFGSANLYGTYDVGKVFANPSLLSLQPRNWAALFGTQLRFGGEQALTSGAVSWVGDPGEVGTFGAALLLARLSAPTLTEIDAAGSPTGVTVTPSSNWAQLELLYQWKFFSIGGGGGIGRLELGDLDPNGDWATLAPNLNAGTTVSLGRLDLGVGFRIGGGMSGGLLGGGLAFRTNGGFKGAVGLSFEGQLGSGDSGQSSISSGPSSFFPSTAPKMFNRSRVGVGATWIALPQLTVRTGLLVWSGKQSLAAGFSVPWREWAFDYGLQMPLDDSGAGAAHAVGVEWNVGRARVPAEAPKFFLTQAERSIAVANFEPQGVSATDAAIISDMLRNRLIKEGAFNVIEKANMDKVLQEQAFQQTGCTTSECAVKLGKILNVKYLVVGSFGKLLDRYVVSMRVVEIETAKGVYSDEAAAADVPGVQDAISRLAVNLTEAVNGAK